MKYDFSGWATKNDILCTDGRTIRKDAFKDCNGKVVPLVWNHQHNDPENVLGHALLQNREEGVYAYCSFNETRKAQSARLAVDHGDVDSLSIYANQLKQNGGNVLHGDIKEVSLVLAGANAGAHIEEVIRHGEISEDEFVIFTGEQLDLEHSEIEIIEKTAEKEPESEQKQEPEKEPEGQKAEEVIEHEDKKSEEDETVEDVFNTLTQKQKEIVYALIAEALTAKTEEDAEAKHSDDESETNNVEEFVNSLTDEQKELVLGLFEQTEESAEDEAAHSDESNENEIEHTEGGNEMKKNVFEGTATEEVEVLSHAEQVEILNEAKKNGSLKDTVLAHGITNIENAYPDNKLVIDRPVNVTTDQGWVTKVLNTVHHTPFSRIRSLFADLTPDAARAKGYLTKGSQKAEETIALLKRETSPTTVYKLQKLDRDDILDITDFDVVAWLRDEMKLKLNEELARAYLIGDGRGVAATDKINEEKIRPIWTMEDLFAINSVAEVAYNATNEDKAKAMIKAAVTGFEDYDGSGNTVLYIAPDMLSNMLLLEDGFGHRIYKTKEDLATAMLVDSIVAVPPMKNKSRTVTISTVDHTRYLAGIIVDLRDYNVGMDKGGQINWFDDFNIDFNKQVYMIETRQSGALVKPHSAIVLEYEVGAEPEPSNG